MIAKIATANLNTKYGTWDEHLYYDGQSETIAMTMGSIDGASDVICRLHSSCIYGHYFNSTECSCQEEMNAAQEKIYQDGKGIIILLDHEGKGNGHYALINSIAHKRAGKAQAEAYEAAGFSRDARDYRSAAKIIKDLNITSIRLITNNQDKVNQLQSLGVTVSSTITL